MRNLLLVLTLLASISAFAVTNGEMAPDFTLPGHTGKSYQLKNFRGKVIVLEWFNSGCPFVKKHYGPRNMQKLQEKYTAKDVIWLTILSSAKGKQGYVPADEAERHRELMGMNSSAFLLDPAGEVGRLYGAKTTPHMFIINPAGKIVYQGAIDSIPSADSGDIKHARNYVAEGLDAVLSNQKLKYAKTKPYGCSVKY